MHYHYLISNIKLYKNQPVKANFVLTTQATLNIKINFHLEWIFNLDINTLSTNPTKWSNTLKQFVSCCRWIVWVSLTILWGWRLKCQLFSLFYEGKINGENRFYAKKRGIQKSKKLIPKYGMVYFLYSLTVILYILTVILKLWDWIQIGVTIKTYSIESNPQHLIPRYQVRPAQSLK